MDGTRSTQAERKELPNWEPLSGVIDQWQKLIDSEDSLTIDPRSSIAGDDRESAPYQVSFCVGSSLHVAIDNLHALKTLIHDQKLLHTMAPFTLARGALETLTAAFWILHPSKRDDRVSRALRWHMKNFTDQNTALSNLEGSRYDGLEVRKASLFEAADRRGILSSDIKGAYSSTEAVLYTAEHASVPHIAFLWRLCSGYAHGRPWAVLGSSDREKGDSPDPDRVHLRLSASPDNVRMVTSASVHLLQVVGELRSERSSNQFV
ncbi:hypothetical protein ACFWFQ_30150 [Nocardia salmonicida]|uniref:hypothetical protein n=1 Tax=Nocardia salmonicida TaxID=53431 RepID=UPI003653F32A